MAAHDGNNSNRSEFKKYKSRLFRSLSGKDELISDFLPDFVVVGVVVVDINPFLLSFIHPHNMHDLHIYTHF